MARPAFVIGGMKSWLILGAIALAASAVILGWPTGGSAGDRARSEVQSLFVNFTSPSQDAHVKSCDQIGANADARIYLCEIIATNCDRIFRFAVDRNSTYGVTPVSASLFMLRHPCTPVHT